MIIFESHVPKDNADDVVLLRKNYFASGDRVTSTDEVVDLETSKTAIILNAEKDGFIEYLCQPGNKVSVGEAVFRIHDDKNFLNSNAVAEVKSNSDEPLNFKLSKSAATYAKDHNIDIKSLELSGFVSLAAIKNAASVNLGSSSFEGKEDQQIIKTSIDLSLSKSNEIAALTAVNATGLVSTVSVKVTAPSPKRLQDGILRDVVFECSRLLKNFPLLNGFYELDQITLYPNISIGFAVDIDDGLKVLVVKDANTLSFQEISVKVDELVLSYLEKNLSVNELKGGTFTITDLSEFGVSTFVPLVNARQSAMLGISAIDDRTGTFDLAISFDHRVTEGRYAAGFLIELKTRLEALLGQSFMKEARCFRCSKTLAEDREKSGIGMYKIIKHDGSEDLICQTCAAGW